MSRKTSFFVFVLLAAFLLGCGLFSRITPSTSTKPDASIPVQAAAAKAEGENELPAYDLRFDQGGLNPLVLEPFPFRIEVYWQKLVRGKPVRWKVLVVNEDDRPHTFVGIRVQGMMAALDFRTIEPQGQVVTRKRDDGSLRKWLTYNLRLDPGEEVVLQIDVTTHLGMSADGVLLFCSQVFAVGNCMALPMSLPASP